MDEEKSPEQIAEERIARDREVINKVYGTDSPEATALIALSGWFHKNTAVISGLREEYELQGKKEAFGYQPQEIGQDNKWRTTAQSLEPLWRNVVEMDRFRDSFGEKKSKMGEPILGKHQFDAYQVLTAAKLVENQILQAHQVASATE